MTKVTKSIIAVFAALALAMTAYMAALAPKAMADEPATQYLEDVVVEQGKTSAPVQALYYQQLGDDGFIYDCDLPTVADVKVGTADEDEGVCISFKGLEPGIATYHFKYGYWCSDDEGDYLEVTRICELRVIVPLKIDVAVVKGKTVAPEELRYFINGDGEAAYTNSKPSIVKITPYWPNDLTRGVKIKGLKVGSSTVTLKGGFLTSGDEGDTLVTEKYVTAKVKVYKYSTPLKASLKKSSFKTSATKVQTTTIKVSKAKGAVTYKSSKKGVKVTSKGKVKIAKGFKGKATITVSCAGTKYYAPATKTLTIKVK